MLWWYSDLKEEGKSWGKSSILRVVPWDNHECVYTQRELLQIEEVHSFTSYILKKVPNEITRSYTKKSQPKKTLLTMESAFVNQDKLLKFWKTEIRRVVLRPNLSKGSEDSQWEQIEQRFSVGRPELWSFPRDRVAHYAEWLETGTALWYAEEWCGFQADTLLRSRTKHLRRTGADTHGHRHQICSHPLK